MPEKLLDMDSEVQADQHAKERAIHEAAERTARLHLEIEAAIQMSGLNVYRV